MSAVAYVASLVHEHEGGLPAGVADNPEDAKRIAEALLDDNDAAVVGDWTDDGGGEWSAYLKDGLGLSWLSVTPVPFLTRTVADLVNEIVDRIESEFADDGSGDRYDVAPNAEPLARLAVEVAIGAAAHTAAETLSGGTPHTGPMEDR